MRNDGMEWTGIALQDLLAFRKGASCSNLLNEVQGGYTEENRYEKDSRDNEQ
jgi:hypothetical protein